MGAGKSRKRDDSEEDISIDGVKSDRILVRQLSNKLTGDQPQTQARGINPTRLRNSWNLAHDVQYRWREPVLCTSNFLSAQETIGRNLDHAQLRVKIQECLKSKKFRASPPQKPKKYLQWMLSRVQMLTKTGGPRMRVVWWRTLCDLGRIPKWPHDKAHIIDLEILLQTWLKECDSSGKMEGRYLYIWMLSHRWERPHYCADCARGNCPKASEAHPDSFTNIKARVLAKWGEHQYEESNVGPMSPEDYYFWIDFAAIDQDDDLSKLAGIEMLPLYVACCGSGLVLYLPNESSIGYEERAWTAIERVLAYTYGTSPTLKKIDSGYVKGSSRWKAPQLVKEKPEYWVQMDNQLTFRMTDPLNGQLTCTQDVEKIEHLKTIVSETPPIDFHGTKEKLVLGQTLFRVEDTCRERSTITQRSRTKTRENLEAPDKAKPRGGDYGQENSGLSSMSGSTIGERWENFREGEPLKRCLQSIKNCCCTICRCRCRWRKTSSLRLDSVNRFDSMHETCSSDDSELAELGEMDSVVPPMLSESVHSTSSKKSNSSLTVPGVPAVSSSFGSKEKGGRPRTVSFCDAPAKNRISFNFQGLAAKEMDDPSSKTNVGLTKRSTECSTDLGSFASGFRVEEIIEEDEEDEDDEAPDDSAQPEKETVRHCSVDNLGGVGGENLARVLAGKKHEDPDHDDEDESDGNGSRSPSSVRSPTTPVGQNMVISIDSSNLDKLPGQLD